MAQREQPLKTLYARNRVEWRKWLEKNHHTSSGVWLVYYKKGSGKPRVPYDEAVEEALCFGWIDSKTNALDDERYMQMFTPRKRGSTWSNLNKQRIEKLIEQGLMTRAGLEKVEAAKQDGSWSKLDAIEELRLPEDLKKALAADETADKNFTAFSNSSKKIIYWWIESAKRPETRTKRIAETVTLAAKNIKANHYRQ